MKKIIKNLFILSFLFSPIFLFAQEKQILIINSYHRGFEWSDLVIEGIEKTLYQKYDYNINVLYMDSKRVNSENYYDTLVELYKIQLKNHKYDLVIAVDNFAYNFIAKHYYELFNDEPILFTGLERYSLQTIKDKKLEDKVYGVIERRAIPEIMEMIPRVIPNLKKLYIINDTSANGDDSLPFITKAVEDSGGKFEVEIIRNSTIEKLSKIFSEKRDDAAVFYIRFYNDENGNLYKNSQIAYMMSRSKLPVFITDTLFSGKGAYGGKLVLIKELGELTGEVAVDILNKNIEPLHVITANDYEFVFDYKKMNEFYLNPRLISSDITLVNMPISFFEKYKDFINFIFLISPFLILLIVGLIYNIFKRMKSEEKLKKTEYERYKHQQFIIQQSKLAEIGEVFSSIAHQWKNPLVEISTIAQEQALLNQDSDKEKNKKYVEDIMTQIRYMTDTVNDFQKFILPSNQKIAFNVEDTIKEMMGIIEHTIKYNYIDIEIDKSRATNLVTFGYKNEFMQTLLNITNNAKDEIAVQRKKRAIKRGYIKFRIYNDEDDIVLEISDNAGGVKEWMLDKLFEAYFTTKKNGLGIGLYMSKLIIEDKMGGKITVFNKEDGLCFKIVLKGVK
ncbi:MAG: ABC transporter substrate binding protein [Campylobacteraceae bacterium]